MDLSLGGQIPANLFGGMMMIREHSLKAKRD